MVAVAAGGGDEVRQLVPKEPPNAADSKTRRSSRTGTGVALVDEIDPVDDGGAAEPLLVILCIARRCHVVQNKTKRQSINFF